MIESAPFAVAAGCHINAEFQKPPPRPWHRQAYRGIDFSVNFDFNKFLCHTAAVVAADFNRSGAFRGKQPYFSIPVYFSLVALVYQPFRAAIGPYFIFRVLQAVGAFDKHSAPDPVDMGVCCLAVNTGLDYFAVCCQSAQ